MITARRQRSSTPRSIWLRRLSTVMRRMVVRFVLRRKVEPPRALATSRASSTNASRRLRAVAVAVPGEHDGAGRDPVPNGSIFTARSRGSTTSCGSTAAPRSSATSAPRVPLSSVRKITFRSGTRPARNLSGSSVVRRPISGSFATSRSGGAASSSASSERAETSRTYGSCSTSAHSNGPSGSGRSANVRSSSPCSSSRIRSAASLSSRTRTADARPLRAKAADEGGEEARADALVDADAKRSGLALCQRGHVGPRGVELRDDSVGVAEQEEAGLGRLDAPRPAGPVEEPLSDDPLELGDLLAHRRLGVPELTRCAPERAGARDRLQGREMAQFDA